MSSSVDLRGFVYRLSPVQKLATWKLDSLHQKLASAQSDVVACEKVLGQLKLNYLEKANEVKDAWLSRLNVTNHSQSLHYLQTQKMRIEHKVQELQGLRLVLDELRRECIDQQKKVDLIDSHRENSIEEYQLEQQNILSAEADRDWNARTQWRAQFGVHEQ